MAVLIIKLGVLRSMYKTKICDIYDLKTLDANLGWL